MESDETVMKNSIPQDNQTLWFWTTKICTQSKK